MEKTHPAAGQEPDKNRGPRPRAAAGSGEPHEYRHKTLAHRTTEGTDAAN
jgi:hypothetical protein